MAQQANFSVDTQQIRAQVPPIENDLHAFVTCYSNIMNATNELVSVNFKGQTGEMFRERIQQYQQNITDVQTWVNNYCTELYAYATLIQSTEDEQRNLASQLRV